MSLVAVSLSSDFVALPLERFVLPAQLEALNSFFEWRVGSVADSLASGEPYLSMWVHLDGNGRPAAAMNKVNEA